MPSLNTVATVFFPTPFLLGIQNLSVLEMAVGNYHCVPSAPPTT